MNTRTKYHPSLIIKHKLGVLEKYHYDIIPKSTVRNWKKQNPYNYYGSKLNQADLDDRLIKTVLSSKKIQCAARAIFYMHDAFKGALLKDKKAFKDLDFRENIIGIINRFQSDIPRKKLFKWLGIKPQQFYAWRRKTCNASLLEICRLRHSNQLSIKEVSTIKNYLRDHLSDLSTKSAVYGKIIREGKAYFSLRTFYHYARLLGYKTNVKKKQRNYSGIKANRPKEILHMDVTVYKLPDNTKAYIYLIQDNYSRHILNWKISKQYNSHIAVENLKEACYKHDLLKEERIDLIVDGGIENKGEVLKFIREQGIIKLKIALKDIPSSNSMIEKLNMQLKYYHLLKNDIPNYNALLIALPKAIYQKCNEVYRHDLGFRTSQEAFINKDFYHDDIRNNIIRARSQRIEYNRSFQCGKYC
jgi:hypothetical protein